LAVVVIFYIFIKWY